MCRLEALTEEVVLVLADEPLLPPFDRGDGTSPLALAFCLSSRPEGAVAVLSNKRRGAVARWLRVAWPGYMTEQTCP